jgi:hypothetical protein
MIRYARNPVNELPSSSRQTNSAKPSTRHILAHRTGKCSGALQRGIFPVARPSGGAIAHRLSRAHQVKSQPGSPGPSLNGRSYLPSMPARVQKNARRGPHSDAGPYAPTAVRRNLPAGKIRPLKKSRRATTQPPQPRVCPPDSGIKISKNLGRGRSLGLRRV